MFDEYGNWVPDDNKDPNMNWGQSDWSQQMGQFDPSQVDWTKIDFTNPDVWSQYGLTPQDFTDPNQAQDYLTSGGGQTQPITLTDDQIQQMQQQGITDFTGIQLTDDQIRQLRDQGLTDEQITAPEGQGTWDKIGAMAKQAGGSLLSAFMKNPLAGLGMLAGGGAALGALGGSGIKPAPQPNLTGPIPLSPEQKLMYGYMGEQAGRENQLQTGNQPNYMDIQSITGNQLAGLRPQAAAEQQARNLSLGNIGNWLQNQPSPTAIPTAYQPWMTAATAAEGNLTNEMNTPGEAGAEAQQNAQQMRLNLDKQFQDSMGPGYATSYPYQQAKAQLERQVTDYLQNDALSRKQQRVSMYTGVANPNAQITEGATQGAYGRSIAGHQANMGTYGGLDQTQRALQGMTATMGGMPGGTAERGLGAIGGIQGRQQDLLNSIYQFNANLQNQKNQNLLQFGGNVLGGSLYALGRGQQSQTSSVPA